MFSPNNSRHAEALNFDSLLKQYLASQKQSIQRYQLANRKYCWIRKSAPTNIKPWLYKLMAFVAKSSKLSILTPSPKQGGTAGLRAEMEQIQKLHHAGILVPDILAYHDDGFMMSSLGDTNLEQAWQQYKHQPKQVLLLWQLGLNAIAEVHHANLHLSQCFARNMIVTSHQKIGFIDFEDNPHTVLSLTDCQVRDWLCYLHSGAIIMHQYGVMDKAQNIWKNIIQQQPSTIQSELGHLLTKIAWLRHFNHACLGRDTQKIALMAQFAHQ